MALHANAKVITEGLVFNLDTLTTKGYQGEPTTNVVPAAKTMSGWSSYNYGNDGTFATEFGTTGYRITNRGSWNGIYRGITLPSTGTYTFSMWIRYLGGSANNNGATVYISGWGGGDSSVGINKSLVGQWQRISNTLTCTTTSVTFYCISYGGTSGGDNSSWECTMPQVELKGYATPWVESSRSTTQAFINSGGNGASITPSGITYNSDGTITQGAGVWQADQTKSASNTFSCWAKTTNSLTSNMLFNAGPTGTGPDLYFSGGSIYWNIWDGSGNPFNATVPANASNGSYHHWVVVNNSADNTAKLYYDGALLGTATYRSATANTTMFIGAGGTSGSYPWNGTVGQFHIYNRALTATEVAANFNTSRARFGL